MSRPLSNSSGDIPSNVQTDAPPSMDHPPCVPCITPYPIQQNNRIWRKLFVASPGPCAGRRTIQSQGHLQPLTSWEEKTIAIPGQVAGVSQKQQHMGTSRTPTNSTTPKGVLPPPPPQQYKEDEYTTKTTSSILASSSYCTRSYYNVNSPTLYWNLPLPMWNLDDDALELPAP